MLVPLCMFSAGVLVALLQPIVPQTHPTMPSFTILMNNDSIVNKVVFCNLKQYITLSGQIGEIELCMI